jgi:uncharacterized protein YecA (UPF0149 family)
MEERKLTREQRIALLEHLDEMSGGNHAPPPWVARNPRNPRQIFSEKKAAPNEACPCGSGKKFKKCCLYRP